MLIAHQIEKVCILCSKTIRGRSDKKFCDDYCRATYNNELNSRSNNFVRNINNALGKNRRILESLAAGDDALVKTTRDELLELGFRFKYLTHTYKNIKNCVYYFCYDYGYLPLPGDLFLIVKDNKNK